MGYSTKRGLSPGHLIHHHIGHYIGHWMNRFVMPSRILGMFVVLLLLGLGCSSCSLPQVQAEDRLFLPLTVEFLDEYILPATDFEGTPVGGLSAIAYDRQRDRLYALSDDRGRLAPPRFYTLQLHTAEGTDFSNNFTDSVSTVSNPLSSDATNNETAIQIQSVDIQSVTYLTQENGDPFPVDTIDPEGLVLSPEGTLFISSEGVTNASVPPWVDEFDLNSGQRLRRLSIPPQYRPAELDEEATAPTMGGQNNTGFEALALSAAGMGMGNDEPYRVFVGLENPLIQDANIVNPEAPQPGRILHYVVSPDQSFVLSEHVYPIEPLPFGAVTNGLVELMALGSGGHFLSLERSYGLGGVRAKLFQTTFSDATDTATLAFLDPDATANAAQNTVPTNTGPNTAQNAAVPNQGTQAWLDGIQPMRKQLVFDLYDSGIRLDNVEGMTLGPRLPDGSRSLLMISDDNFNPDDQVTQLLLFRIKGLPPM